MRTKLLLTSIAALFLATGTAHTETDVLGCFARTYDRAHLARHPDQLITAVKLRIYKPPENEAQYWFGAQFKVRGRSKPLNTGGACYDVNELDERGFTSGVYCFVECDGGGVNVVPHAGGAMMYLKRIRVAECGQDVIDGGDELTEGKDDRVFRLDRANAAACKGME